MIRTVPITVDTFDEVAGSALEREPVLNQVLLGVIAQYRKEPARYAAGVRLLAMRDELTGETGVAMQTPPYKALVSHVSEPLAVALGREFIAQHPDARAVFGHVRAAHAFSRGAGAVEARTLTKDGVFELRAVSDLPPVAGRARVATPEDGPLLQEWLEAFNAEALPAGWPKDPNAGARMAASDSAWIWLDERGTPVSMASNPRRVAGWWGIAYVFTPRQHRGHGYASGVVAHASRLALARGAQGCTLFTDLMNPVSNRIYERIGYRRVGEFASLEW